ncbi:MAG: type II toxin-antitoxin system PemK/MazF family toxin [Sulfurimonas sp.]|nr:type II toxin-antitoxin system PemK/MazF family toxin [Sulfurimonas sp.]
MIKDFDNWNTVKQKIQDEEVVVGFKQRDIFYMKMGKNIGYEQDGKGDEFVRPVVIVKGFNKFMFFAIPLSTKIKDGKFYYSFEFQRNGDTIVNNALLSQMRLFSTKRLLNKIGVMKSDDFVEMKIKFKKLID